MSASSLAAPGHLQFVSFAQWFEWLRGQHHRINMDRLETLILENKEANCLKILKVNVYHSLSSNATIQQKTHRDLNGTCALLRCMIPLTDSRVDTSLMHPILQEETKTKIKNNPRLNGSRTLIHKTWVLFWCIAKNTKTKQLSPNVPSQRRRELKIQQVRLRPAASCRVLGWRFAFQILQRAACCEPALFL